MSVIKNHHSTIIESTEDYFSDQKANQIPSTSFSTLDPLDILCFEEEAEEFELFHTSEETYISDK